MKHIKTIIATLLLFGMLVYGYIHLTTTPHTVRFYIIATEESPIVLESLRVNGEELMFEHFLITGRGRDGDLGGIAADMKPQAGIIREGTLILRVAWVDLVTQNAFVGHMTIRGDTLKPDSLLNRQADVRLAFVTGGWLIQTPPFEPISANPFETSVSRICGEPTLEQNVDVAHHLRQHPDLSARIGTLRNALSSRPSCREVTQNSH